jgi:tetratricopeptide (TPR) repeat protein
VGRHADAVKLLEETLPLMQKKLGREHDSTMLCMNTLANSYFALGRHADAFKLKEETLALRKEQLGANHPDTLESMYGLAWSYRTVARHADALKLFEETLALQTEKLGADHPHTLLTEQGVILSLVDLNRPSEALPRIDPLLTLTDQAAAAGKSVDPRIVPSMFTVRLRILRDANDLAGCRSTAEKWEQRGPKTASEFCDAARFRAATAAVQAQATDDNAALLASAEADRAMAWLTKAVDAGYKGRAQLEKDPDLEHLRPRDDFQRLLQSLPAE